MSDNAKLRTLRDKMLDCAKMWHGYETNASEAAYWSGRAWAAEYAAQCIELLLAEPEPVKPEGSPWTEDERDDPNWGRVCICRKAVRSGERFQHAACVGPSRRETVEEEIARLYGHEGRP